MRRELPPGAFDRLIAVAAAMRISAGVTGAEGPGFSVGASSSSVSAIASSLADWSAGTNVDSESAWSTRGSSFSFPESAPAALTEGASTSML